MPDEEFSEPHVNVITSSRGFSVEVLGRTGMRYVEGGRSVWIDAEVLATPSTIALFPHSMRSWEGSELEPLTDEDRQRIVGDIQRAFDACGYRLDVAEPFDWDSVALRRPGGPGPRT